ncbi:MAG TPA: Ldh family oxidoreductase [Candidatus Methylomirabilis sp.]|nr:Ldh family oxidoreductase [Candidatus Methylomirabilis sp.]
MRVPAEKIRSHLTAVFSAWGMSEDHARTTALMMTETDLRGVDSHGISMLPTYDKEFRLGRLNMRPNWKAVREGPATALIDADASLGHPVSAYAMNLAVDKCREIGVAIVSVFNSHHFGAAGCYSKIAADRGAIGLVTSGTRGVTMVPTFGAEPVMGTNPIAFAAPARRNPPFQLDMATTTVAAGKVKVHKLNHKPLPTGWVVDGDGRPVTDETDAFSYVFDRSEGGITPLGGTRDVGSHKGYGLAVMVHILGATLGGASFSPIRNRTQRPSDPHNIGHFFLAIDPRAFRADGLFEDDLDRVIDTLHAAKPADPNQPVLVAGDPEMATRAERLEHGVPIPDDLMVQLREVAQKAGVPFDLGG